MNTQTRAARFPLYGLYGLLAVHLLVGYEWLMSGLAKIVRGGFPSGLSAELRDKSQGTAHWYKSFLDGVVIPHGVTFGYLIELGELLVGLGLIVAAALWLFRWDRLPATASSAVLLATAAASLAGIFMAVNFHLANGASHPWLIARDGFDEGIDLDSLLPAIQFVMVGVSLATWRATRLVRADDPVRPAVRELPQTAEVR